MTAGAGKYDPQLMQALTGAGATRGILLVMDGTLGEGFAVQADLFDLIALPAMLRYMADQIEADGVAVNLQAAQEAAGGAQP